MCVNRRTQYTLWTRNYFFADQVHDKSTDGNSGPQIFVEIRKAMTTMFPEIGEHLSQVGRLG